MEKKIEKLIKKINSFESSYICSQFDGMIENFIPYITEELEKIVNNSAKNEEIEEFFNKICNLYPNKSGKSAIKPATKKKLFKVGYENIKYAINKYLQDPQLKRNNGFKDLLMLSSFMNTRYVEFLPEENLPKEKISNQIIINPSKRKEL